MTNQWRYYSTNLWQICKIIGPETYDIKRKQKLAAKVLTTSLFFFNILSSWTNNVTNFSKVSRIIFPPNLHLRSLETCKFKKSNWQCSQYPELKHQFVCVRWKIQMCRLYITQSQYWIEPIFELKCFHKRKLC